ncbi:hypothetical protein AB685_16420 [Bacillus sp. LL01]|uniref:bifunctional adenosylcobinamide kinase/adenosylcobinamide-phosphate guanylyltransferase n=1 Tax=Bacillus sp. LL01 TaxID=1665556 RepID=UPI00064D4839|nr:bifunctional adenosylcobinamide kinase/adenosylcobinamide-phosphate guanylyltransferase [Bacillus sp. LL01]KMJ57584.1 hypothetical protein AB685_16420 [Bacillus sp. LL01]
MIVFVSGGARSGKSSFAERLALSFYKKRDSARLIYLATAKKSDAEMERRIAIHRTEREDCWEVMEEPIEVGWKMHLAREEDVVLLDCLTIWLSNVLFDGGGLKEAEVLEKVEKLVNITRRKGFTLLVVSNDVNEELPSRYESVQYYVYLLEKIHQFLMHKADVAVQVRAGIPKYWKGGKVVG